MKPNRSAAELSRVTAYATATVVSLRALLVLTLFLGFPGIVHSEAIRVGDIEISPSDFSAEREPEKRIAKCLACHGNRGGGDIDFGPDAHYGTPAVSGMREDYLKESLIAYKTGTRNHQEMSVVSSMLDKETIDFMARALARFEAPPMRSAGDLATLAEEDSLFKKGQTIALQGRPQKGVPACLACHGSLGQGSEVGPRLAGQNAMYIQNQFEAFADGSRKTPESSIMQSIVTGLMEEDLRAVAYYYSFVVESH